MTSSRLLPVATDALASQSKEPELRLFRGDTLVRTYVLTPKGLTLGKVRSNDVVIDVPSVSRTHARIVRQGGHWLIEDAGSTNGTFLYEGDQLIYSSVIDPDPWLLRDQQEIRLGPHPGEWRLLFSDPTTTAPAPAVYIEEQLRRVWIRGRLVKLPRDHYTILLHLYKESPAPCSYEALCAALEGDRKVREKITGAHRIEPSLDSLQQLVHRLRSRVELDPKQPRLVLQVAQFGYRLRKDG